MMQKISLNIINEIHSKITAILMVLDCDTNRLKKMLGMVNNMTMITFLTNNK